ncbi:putative beta-galactosidase [Bimuria novae-zelandiae CBS 107.79]|uniref:Putative beta-galactosidase n=1 Tax=Bimuria novae-zelandiae CBS 107.79 TaxID=1447943 RepID=A0A6A5UX10_9PLEO|nr:putative beta-galactosidase [Bimuria novae-zelandiae CBS 107.79]
MLPFLGAFALLLSVAFGEGDQTSNSTGGYVLKQGPLDTPWTDKVGTNPWPEYPRPQMARSNPNQWKNLNGVWQYKNLTKAEWQELEKENVTIGGELEGGQAVLVPFCLESALSGVMGNFTIYSRYRTTFDVPSTWNDRVLLNFGAVDYEATVYVNGKNVAHHVGGYWSFNVDITEALNDNGTNELFLTYINCSNVHVFDPTNLDPYNIPLGKQKLIPEHIFYTPCSGIWQTVWLESVPSDNIDKLDIHADADGKINVTIHTSSQLTVADFVLYETGSTDIKAKLQVPVNEAVEFPVDSIKLWSPDSPTLYNISVTLGNDTVQSYTGFRTVSRGVIDGVQRPLLNGEFIFWFGTLDQGYWPDGLHTPPSLEAMVFDIKALKEVGYNMVRKHIKVEPALFYQACDQLGLMLIQDMPALATSQVWVEEWPACPIKAPSLEQRTVQREFDRQLEILIEQHKSYPSIVTWVIYNEGWGQPSEHYDGVQNYTIDYDLTNLVRQHDQSRLVNTVTGWFDHGAGDFHDNHHYSSPQCGTPWYSDAAVPYDPTRIAIQGEFAGIGQNVTAEHAWKVRKSIEEVQKTYELDATVEIWNLRAHMIFKELQFQIENFACSGAVWTQTTDVEGEVNGMLTYDRRINRMNKEQWKADIKALYDAATTRNGSNGTVYLGSRGEMGI